MKKVFVALVALVACLPLHAQLSYNTVTATITDPGGNPYANAGYTISLVNNQGLPVSSASTPNGQLFNAQPVTGILDAAGRFSVRVVPNTILSKPSGTQWKFVITPPADSAILTYSEAWALTFQTAISGDVDLSTQLSAVARPVNFSNLKTGQSTWSGTDSIARAAAAAALLANKPGGAPPQAQWNANGAFGGIAGSAVDPTNGYITNTGIQYAKGWQSGAGNNGILNASSPNSTVIADPSYGNTEYYSWTPGSLTHPWGPTTGQTHVIDYRNGTQIDTYRDPPVSLFDGNSSGQLINFLNLQAPATSLGRNVALRIYNNMWQPGISLGNPSFGPQSWTIGKTMEINQVSASPGIHEGMTVGNIKTGIGDNVGAYFYNYNYGGATATSDEGNHGFAWHGDEINTTFKGSVFAGGGGTGATTVKITCTVDCNNGPGDGRYLVDQTNVLDSGNVISATAPLAIGTPGAFLIDHTVTPSTAIGTLSGNCNAGAAPLPVGVSYNTVTCPVTVVSGAFAAGSSLVCFNGGYHEQALITNVTGTGPFNLTMKLRHSHISGSMIAQGGPCGSFINFTANDATNQVATPLHFPIDLIGAPDSTHLYYAFFYAGGSTGTIVGGAVGGLGAVIYGNVFAVTNLTNIGGIVYLTSTLNTNVPFLVGTTLQISGAAVSAYNGPCTNSKWIAASNQYSCTQASSVGAGVSATGNIAAGTSQYGNSAYVTWAGAEVLDILDHSVNPPVAYNAGVYTLTTEPNNAAWADAHAVEEAHHYALRVGSGGTTYNYNKMLGSSDGLSIVVGTESCCGNFAAGTSGTNSFSVLSLSNASTTNGLYKYHGGYVTPPGGILFGGSGAGTGAYNYGLAMLIAPDPFGTPIIYAGCPASGCTDPFYYYYPILTNGNGGTGGLQYRPYGNEYTTVGNWVWNSDFGKQTFRDTLTFGPLTTVPVLSTPIALVNGGSLPDATTYFYTVYAINSAGNALQSAEKTITTATSVPSNTNSISLTWTRIQGATAYFVCRSLTSGTETKGPTIANIQLGATYLDTGTNAYSGGACPTTDTSRGGVEQAGWVGMWSSGTGTPGFELKLQAPANMAATTTLTVTKINTVSITPAAVTASTCAEQTFNTYLGLATGQVVNVSPPAFLGAHVWIASTRVSAANTLAIAFCADATGGTPAAGIYSAMAF